MKKSKKQKKKFRWSNIGIFFMFLIGTGVLCYPVVSDYWNQYRNTQLISEYGQSIGNLSEEKYKEIWNDAITYNKQHFTNNIIDTLGGEEYISSDSYSNLLNPNQDGIMGYLEIPKIKSKIAIYHGIATEALEKGCGHIEGTSLPVGGMGSHAVLAAHRGLPSAKLFTDLDELEIGDKFYIHVLDKTFAYRVNQIKIVLPTEEEELAIEENSDYVTLLTCTPYSVNTHRLLVRGERTEYKEYTERKMISQERKKINLARKVVICSVIILLFLGIYLYQLTKKHKSCTK